MISGTGKLYRDGQLICEPLYEIYETDPEMFEARRGSDIYEIEGLSSRYGRIISGCSIPNLAFNEGELELRTQDGHRLRIILQGLNGDFQVGGEL